MNTDNIKIKIIQVNENITLKQIEISDAKDIFHIIDTQRDYLRKWLPFIDYTKVIADTEKFIHSIIDVPLENRDHIFVIHYNKVFVGLVGLKGIDRENKRTEIGYWLSESEQKKGIITESVKALMEYAYYELDMYRIQIKCAVGNTPSRNIPLKLSYKFEGIERAGEFLINGIFADIEVYSKLKSDL